MYMEGNGEFPVTVVIQVRDEGQDIETLMIKVPDRIDLSFDVSGLVNGRSGTITQEFDVPTTEIGVFQIWVSVIDSAGDSAGPVHRNITVEGDPFTWMERAAALPNALNDVIWEPGTHGFIAVGDAGTILTSDDGLTWVEQDSGTDVDLHDIDCVYLMGFGGACFAVGDAGTVLSLALPSDWSLFYDGPEDLSLQAILAVAYGFNYVPLAVGTMVTTDTACILQTNSAGDQWSKIEPTGQSGQHMTGIGVLPANNEGHQFVATMEVPFPDQGRVLVSADGLAWVEVFISDSHESTYSLQYYGEGLWAGGSSGNVYATADGVNWTRYETPAVESKLVAMSSGDSNSSTLMAHGFNEAIGLGEQIGVATSDGGQTWQSFVIGAAFEPRGLAYFDGRWVSVGQSLAEPGKGAIYTTQ
jgi:photosystem II stability/assembly factor-like uncharacterized protein